MCSGVSGRCAPADCRAAVLVGPPYLDPTARETAADVKSFGCRPARVIDRDGGRRPKAPEERTRGTAVSGWPMGIWRGSGFGEGWFSQDPREVKAADDCGLAAAGVLDGVIEDQSEMPCRRLQVAA